VSLDRASSGYRRGRDHPRRGRILRGITWAEDVKENSYCTRDGDNCDYERWALVAVLVLALDAHFLSDPISCFSGGAGKVCRQPSSAQLLRVSSR
jgi:hypothetical protein